MDRIVVIANPVASQFTGGSHRDVMAQLASSHEVDAVWPGSAPEAATAAAEAVASGASIVVAMGGDGIVHHVSQALVGTRTSLGIVPTGTTNVVARLFGIPFKPAKAARLIGSGQAPTTVGTVRLTLTRGDTETIHHAVFACGFGLDAEVVRVADSDPYRKYRFGSIHYARTALGVGLGRFPSTKPHVAIEAEGRESLATTALIQFREAYTYFGKLELRIVDESPDPMAALIVTRLRRRRVPHIVFNAVTHRDLARIEGFEIWEDLKTITMSADPPVAVQADGESLGMVDGGSIEWSPDSLLVLAGS
jgi:diacylglycerol kinase family enzyme